ncbi:MAG: ATP-binding protein [Planctomycetaceae bacterium]|jgi:hypothetical protein|nr:ATP-binding protein [Planctomycetaceae bacterium]
MDNELFQQLLYSSESDSLDFKKEQYKFEGATNIEKSKLIKDILAFANSWRRCDAYILIGVKENNGEKEVVGISEHIDDAKIQQLVNSNTNRPIDFSYQQFEYENKKIGIIYFPVMQDRPYYFKVNYKEGTKEIIRQNEVYVRRGSTTDIASPDEVAKMGNSAYAVSVNFEVQLYDNKLQKQKGEFLLVDYLFVQKPNDICDYEYVPIVPHGMFYYSDKKTNKDYYREMIDFLYKKISFFPVYISVKNTGNSNAENVRIEIIINNSDVCDILDKYQLPNDNDWPKRIISRMEMIDLKKFPVRSKNIDGVLEVSKDANSYHIETEYRHIQSGRTVYLHPFFISKNQSGKIVINGSVFSQLKPQNFSLYLDCIIDVRELTIKMIDEIDEKRQ